MYQKNLSETFDKSGHDAKGHPWNFEYKIDPNTNKKIFYAVGDSWLFNNYFARTVLNKYNDYLFINRSVPGISNSLMLDNIKKDLPLLSNTDAEVVILVCFSEVGRSIKDFSFSDPKLFSSTQDFFGDILHRQFDQTHHMLKKHKHFLTTAFVSNNYNENSSIIDHCRPTVEKPNDVFTVYSNGIFEYLKERKSIFKFNFIEDIEKSLKLKNYLQTCLDTDISLHPITYTPYEHFLEDVFKKLHKHDK